MSATSPSTPPSDPSNASTDPSEPTGRAGRPVLPVVVGGAVVFLLGAVIGLLGGLVLADDEATEALPATDSATCDEANDIVEAAVAEMGVLDSSPVQDAGFFAALIVEQRKLTYVMDEVPDCFTLADRAGAHGLLAGIDALLDAATFDAATSDAPSSPAGDDG